jgi:hypothetical protein
MEKRTSRRWKRIGILFSTIAALILLYRFAAAYYALPPIMRYLDPGACLKLDEATYKNIGRDEFHAIETNCDTLGKEEFVEVYAYRNDANSALPKWLRRRTVVFVYDPGDVINPLPAIQSNGTNGVKFTVPLVSSVWFERKVWDGNQIDYKIGKVFYPN